eukprot:135280-Rhodomonas_salina.1
MLAQAVRFPAGRQRACSGADGAYTVCCSNVDECAMDAMVTCQVTTRPEPPTGMPLCDVRD